jgi:hypothetical protein
MLTIQEAFDKILLHARTQKTKSLKHPNSPLCAYRSPEGLKCFIGALIPDDSYDPIIEGASILGIVVSSKAYRPGYEKLEKSIPIYITKENLFIFQQLQNIHDTFNPEFWEQELSKIAQTYNLNYEAPSNVQ